MNRITNRTMSLRKPKLGLRASHLVLTSALVLMAGAMLAPTPAQACINDSYTERVELRGLPEVDIILVGGFARESRLFYDMRIARAEAELAKDPDNYGLYDDIAAAYDRIGDPATAQRWMDYKYGRMVDQEYTNDAPNSTNPWYRYYANQGTFRAHKWLRDNRRDLTNVEEMKVARELIAKAISIYPGAHGGREASQLMVMDWLIELAESKQRNPVRLPSGKEVLPDILGLIHEGQIRVPEGMDLEHEIKGLKGLMMLGAAWNSFDVSYSLAVALHAAGYPGSAMLALERAYEVYQSGGRSIQEARTGEMWRDATKRSRAELFNYFVAEYASTHRDGEVVGGNYLRARAHDWQDAREAFMQPRLVRGEHPDTHGESFWDGFEQGRDWMDESKLSSLAVTYHVPKRSGEKLGNGRHVHIRSRYTSKRAWAVGFLGAVALFGVLLVLLLVRARGRCKAKRAQATPGASPFAPSYEVQASPFKPVMPPPFEPRQPGPSVPSNPAQRPQARPGEVSLDPPRDDL